MIKESIASQLGKEKGFQLILDKNKRFFPKAMSSVRKEALTNKSDVIIYGNFYVEKDKLYVITEIYDALKNQLKMRKTYNGVITVDIFDT